MKNEAQLVALGAGAVPALRQWFRVDECEAIFGVSRTKVYEWIDEGILDGRQIANTLMGVERRHMRVTRDSIQKLLNDEARRVI